MCSLVPMAWADLPGKFEFISIVLTKVIAEILEHGDQKAMEQSDHQAANGYAR